jgi:hypothetical protein
LLAGELGVTRASLWREFAHGRLQVWPFVHNALRKPIRNGQIIVLPGDLQERELAEF